MKEIRFGLKNYWKMFKARGFLYQIDQYIFLCYVLQLSMLNFIVFFQINPTWKAFANNAGRLLESMKASKEDREFRAEMRQKAKELVNG